MYGIAGISYAKSGMNRMQGKNFTGGGPEMKKIIITMLVAALGFSITGCELSGGNDINNTTTESTLENTPGNTENTNQETGDEAAFTEDSGTQATQGKTMEATLYFASEDNSAVRKETREILVVDGAILRACILALLEGPKTEGLRQTIPEGTAILGVNLKNNVAIVDFSGEYLNVQGLSEVTERVSIVNTLTEIPGVEKVRIMVEGKELTGPSGEPFGDMLPAALDADGVPVPGEVKTLTLYFGDSDAEKVVAEKREVTINKGDSVEKAIILELMKGPEDEQMNPVMPKGTRLLSAKTESGRCTLDFSKEFVDNHPGGTSGEAMTLYSIINSLTELSTIKEVQFLIEGEKREIYTHRAFDEPFARDNDIIGK